jgi:hypothetical protein
MLLFEFLPNHEKKLSILPISNEFNSLQPKAYGQYHPWLMFYASD